MRALPWRRRTRRAGAQGLERMRRSGANGLGRFRVMGMAREWIVTGWGGEWVNHVQAAYDRTGVEGIRGRGEREER